MELTFRFDQAGPADLALPAIPAVDTARLSSATLVLVAGAVCPDRQQVQSFVERLHDCFTDVELVIVASGVAPDVARELKLLVEHVPDSLVVFLAEPAHDDIARLVGIDHAVSDYVVFASPSDDEERALAKVIQEVKGGFDLVTAVPPKGEEQGLFTKLLVKSFGLFVRYASRIEFEEQPATFRVLSRAAALYLVSRREGEVLIRARSLGAAFPATEVAIEGAPTAVRKRSLRRDLERAVRLITTGSASLLRASSYLALFGGGASAAYALYVLAIYVLFPEVQPGWTTLSLQLSGMLFLFSVQFLLLAENVIHMSSNSGISQRRHLIVRELRSSRSRREALLNVVDSSGRFQLGAPSFDHQAGS